MKFSTSSALLLSFLLLASMMVEPVQSTEIRIRENKDKVRIISSCPITIAAAAFIFTQQCTLNVERAPTRNKQLTTISNYATTAHPSSFIIMIYSSFNGIGPHTKNERTNRDKVSTVLYRHCQQPVSFSNGGIDSKNIEMTPQNRYSTSTQTCGTCRAREQ